MQVSLGPARIARAGLIGWEHMLNDTFLFLKCHECGSSNLEFFPFFFS